MHKPSHLTSAEACERLTTCLECGSNTLEERCDEETFEYGGREKPFRVTARIPSILCTTCGFRFYNEAAEQARHEAACRHLGVMTPEEIRALRKRYGSTQEAFAELTGLGVASLGRWERGEGIQNEAYDALLHLLTYRENVERLRHRRQSESDPDYQKLFLTQDEVNGFAQKLALKATSVVRKEIALNAVATFNDSELLDFIAALLSKRTDKDKA